MDGGGGYLVNRRFVVDDLKGLEFNRNPIIGEAIWGSMVHHHLKEGLLWIK